MMRRKGESMSVFEGCFAVAWAGLRRGPRLRERGFASAGRARVKSSVFSDAKL